MTDDRSGKLTPRDEVMLTDLYFAPYLKTRQLQYGNFRSFGACERHLYRLRAEKRVIDCHQPRKGLTIWSLTRESWHREQESLPPEPARNSRFAQWTRKWPKDIKVDHIVATNDVWMRLSPKLDRDLGRYPGWEWTDERRAYREYPLRGSLREKSYHRPDAEIRFGDHLFFVERQTARARKTPADFEERCRNYRNYLDFLKCDERKTILLFACDTVRDMGHAHEAAMSYRVPHQTGSVEEIVEYVSDIARKVVAGAA